MEGLGYGGLLVALLTQFYYGLRVSALYNSLWYLSEVRAGVFPRWHGRWYGSSLLPMGLLAGAWIAWLPLLIGTRGASVAGAGVALAVCGVLGLHGRALWRPRVPAYLWAGLVVGWGVGVVGGEGMPNGWLAVGLALLLAYLGLCYATRREHVAPSLRLHSRLLEPLGTVLGIALLPALLWLGLRGLALSDFATAYGPALAATLFLLAVLGYRAIFGVRYWLAAHTQAVVAVDGAGLRVAVYLLGCCCLVRRWRAAELSALRLWVYGTATPRYRQWHPRLEVGRSELVVLVGARAVPLAFVEGPCYQTDRDPNPLEVWMHPHLAAHGEALAQSLGLPWQVEPVSCRIMPGDDVAGPMARFG